MLLFWCCLSWCLYRSRWVQPPGHSFPTLQWAMELYSVSLFPATYYNPVFVCGGIYLWQCSLPQIHLFTFPPKSLILAEGWAPLFTVPCSHLKTYKPQRVEYRVSLFFSQRNRPSFCKTFYIDARILCFDSTYQMIPNRHINGWSHIKEMGF